jgi:predicted dehydrogenase
VIVTTATTAHSTIIPAAAAAGKHVFAEKVIAPTLRESLEIVDATRRAGVIFSVALTRAGDWATKRTQELIGGGEIGQSTAARVRFAHDGALPAPDRPDGWLPARFFDRDESGGGAMIDFGAHPLYLNRLFLGMPDSVSAFYGEVSGRGVDDNSVAILGYGNGAFGVAETSFVNVPSWSGFEVNGTQGRISFSAGSDHLLLYRGRDEPIKIAMPEEHVYRPMTHWLKSFGAKHKSDDNLRLALELSAITEAAARSAERRCAVQLAEIEGWDTIATHFPERSR